MATPRPRAEILRELAQQLRPVLDTSAQGMYLFLDESHKLCNEAFAHMLGYDSPADWDRQGSFTELYVEPASQHTLVSAYQRAMRDAVASVIDVTWKRRDGTPVPTTVQLVPVAHEGELMALHFIAAR